MNFFDKVNDTIRNVEGSVVNFISSIAPWFAPLPAAVMSFMHMTGVLQFDPWVAWAVAATIEILGFSTISTWLDFWSWNRKFTSDKSLKRAPVTFVVISFGFYLGIVISMNVLLDVSKAYPNLLDPAFSVIIVRSLLTLMTIPAGLIIATRVQHHELIDEMRKDKMDRRQAGQPVSSSNNTGTGTPRNSAHKIAAYAMLDDILAKEGRIASFTEVRDALDIPKGSASRFRTSWMILHNVHTPKP